MEEPEDEEKEDLKRSKMVVGQRKTVQLQQQPLHAQRDRPKQKKGDLEIIRRNYNPTDGINFYDDDQDEEHFFEELAQDFNRAQQLGGFLSGSSRLSDDGSLQSPANDQRLDHSRFRTSDVLPSPSERDHAVIQDRDEAKEDEYDYFDQPNQQQESNELDENAQGRLDYHVMDDGGALGVENPDDEEMLDEDEIKAKNANMLQELYDKIQKEEEDEQN